MIKVHKPKKGPQGNETRRQCLNEASGLWDTLKYRDNYGNATLKSDFLPGTLKTWSITALETHMEWLITEPQAWVPFPDHPYRTPIVSKQPPYPSLRITPPRKEESLELQFGYRSMELQANKQKLQGKKVNLIPIWFELSKCGPNKLKPGKEKFVLVYNSQARRQVPWSPFLKKFSEFSLI